MLKSIITLSFLPLFVFGMLAFQNPNKPDQGNAKIDDGFYLIYRKGDTQKELLPLAENEAIISFSNLFLEKTEPGNFYLVVDKNDFVPMLLSESPEAILQEDKRTKLLLSLTDEAKTQLTEFTKKHLNKHTCIVVDGEALTMHKVRTVIDGGKMQITRCTDNACKILYPILEQNVVK